MRGLKKTRAYIGKTKNRKLAANERKISTLISNDLLAKHYYSRTRKLGKEEGAAAMRANQSITRSRGAELMEPCCATNSWARQGWTGGCWLGLYEASTGTKTKLRRSSEKRQRHCSYEAMKGKVRRQIQCVCCNGLESLSSTQRSNTRERTTPSECRECPDTRYMPSTRGHAGAAHARVCSFRAVTVT